MKEASFISQLASEILASAQPQDISIVFPNKRPASFLARELADKAGRPIMLPAIYSFDEFLEKQTPYRMADRFDLLLELYEAYNQLSGKKIFKPQSLEHFLGWAPVLLNDFDEIDKFLIDPSFLFTRLADIKELDIWAEEPENVQGDYLRFFQSLHDLYRLFRQRLATKGMAYGGMIYRYAAGKAAEWAENFDHQSIWLAGFNALGKAEEEIFSRLIEKDKAKLFWQAHETYIQPPYEAGFFMRRNRKHPIIGRTVPDRFEKDIRSGSRHLIIQAPDEHSQVEWVARRLTSLPAGTDWLRTVVVVTEPSLLIPLLYHLPAHIPHINISYGYPIQHHESIKWLAGLIRWFSLREQNMPVDLNQWLQWMRHEINRNIFPDATTALLALWEGHPQRFVDRETFCSQAEGNPWMELLCEVKPVKEFLQKTETYIRQIINAYDEDAEKRAVWILVGELWNKLTDYQENYDWFKDFYSFEKIFHRLLGQEQIPYEGHPLQGLQVMGLLETRLLEFDRVFVLSAEEGNLPAARSGGSFIPPDVRRHLGLPLQEEKNAITAFHFYRLVSSAPEVYYLYNSSAGGLHGGEPSRFIQQIQYKWPAKGIDVQTIALQPSASPVEGEVFWPKDEEALSRLRTYATERGFSPSAITSYWHYPEDFYRRYVLQWTDDPAATAYIAPNDLGSVIHETLEQLYSPWINKPLTPGILQDLVKKAPSVTEKVFRQLYLNNNKRHRIIGKNLLALEASVRMVKKIIGIDRQALREGHQIVIRFLENKLSAIHEFDDLGTIKFKGILDRLDEFDGQWRMVDYKTGRPKLKNKMPDPADFPEKRDLIYQFQLWFYAWMAKKNGIIPADVAVENVIYTPRSSMALHRGIPFDGDAEEVFMQVLGDAVKDIFDKDKDFGANG